jgi:hypothetical protein
MLTLCLPHLPRISTVRSGRKQNHPETVILQLMKNKKTLRYPSHFRFLFVVSPSPTTNIQLNYLWSCIYTLPYFFMVWCLIKHIENFTFTLESPLFCFYERKIRRPYMSLSVRTHASSTNLLNGFQYNLVSVVYVFNLYILDQKKIISIQFHSLLFFLDLPICALKV